MILQYKKKGMLLDTYLLNIRPKKKKYQHKEKKIVEVILIPCV